MNQEFPVTAHLLARVLRVLNLLDVLGTLYTVCELHADEVNPLMASLIHASPVAFVLVKLIGVGWASFALAERNRKGLLTFAIVLYVAALASHAVCMAR
jgi:hypothetical protein